MFTGYLFLLLFSIIAIESYLQIELTKKVKLAISQTKKTLGLISNKKISDHWKEKAVPAYSLRLFKISFLILAYFLILLLFLFALHKIDSKFLQITLSLPGFAFSFIAVVAYLKIRTFFLR